MFTCCRLKLDDKIEFLKFLQNAGLSHVVSHLTVTVPSDYPEGRSKWWQSLYDQLQPQCLTIVASPHHMYELAGCGGIRIDWPEYWAFNIPYQILQFSTDTKIPPYQKASLLRGGLIFGAHPWSHIHFNEGSSLKAYSSYEYFHRRIPSFLTRHCRLQLEDCFYHNNGALRTFDYTALFPLASHLQEVYQLLTARHGPERVQMRIAPHQSADLTSLTELAGKVDLSDAWMEITSGLQNLRSSMISSVRGISELVMPDFAGRASLAEEFKPLTRVGEQPREVGIRWEPQRSDDQTVWRKTFVHCADGQSMSWEDFKASKRTWLK